MSSNQRFGIIMAVLILVSIALIRFTPAQQHTGSSGRGAQVIDITPESQVSPRRQVVYDFDRQTVSLVEISNTDTSPDVTVIKQSPLNVAPAQ